jgi:CheY-like chemotaxis protein
VTGGWPCKRVIETPGPEPAHSACQVLKSRPISDRLAVAECLGKLRPPWIEASLCRTLFELWLQTTMKQSERVCVPPGISFGMGCLRPGRRCKRGSRKATQLKPDVILVDLSMPRLNGFEVARCIHEQLTDCEILVVTEQDPCFMEHLSPKAGVSGYVVKSRISLHLLSALEAASRRLPSSVPASKTV